MAQNVFTILIDGECPLCRREADLMRRMDRGRGGLVIEDIARPGFDFERYGISLAQAMGTIHGVTAEGRVVTGMEVFRRAYAAVGWGWALAPTGWPVLRSLFDAMYRWFARNRLVLTGRRGACEGDRCRPAAQRPAP